MTRSMRAYTAADSNIAHRGKPRLALESDDEQYEVFSYNI